MNKMDNVNFTGIKNIASLQFQREGFKPFKNLSMTLCDDVNGKDLQEFKNVLQKIDNKNSAFVNEDTPHALNIECLELNDGRKFLSVNGTVLEERDRDLPLFSYIAKVTKKISQMSEKDMVVNNDYKNIEARDKLLYGAEFENYDELVEKGAVDAFFDKSSVKDAGAKINKFIQDIMFSYFGLK